MRGPQAKPAALKKLEGNPSKRKPKNEPKPIGDARRPAWLPPKAAEEWSRVIATFPPEFYTAADVPTLAVYCCAWVTYQEALAQVTKSLMARGSTKQLVAHPALAIARQQAEIILRASDRLGMSPAARARLDVAALPGAGESGENSPGTKWDGLIPARGSASRNVN